ncbi:ABC transporter ATP-binding protein [Desnuesiella massiliensis]|uniref:ABC transporter ATP-binding protein n=1 Tax=Desnuesiella massiliensis TaxID=1650662 RepID=UPI0006E234E3|nr:ABC transporter ATP-binding protein [Desnuesiella massiliensis]
MDKECIIKVKNLKKDFDGKAALKDLSFSIKKGEIFGFLGPSGAGKTTTIKILTGQLKPSCGEAEVFNRNVLSFNKEIFKHIGILTDNSGLYERLSVYDNLELFSKLYEVNKEKIFEVLEQVNLKADAKTVVKKLSKGMKQRVILARAILSKPDLLFLDEPTAALDPSNCHQIHNVLRELNNSGTTIFLTTHNMEEADKLCHRVAFLNEGTISALDTPENLKIKYAEDSIEVLLNMEERKKVIIPKNLEGAERIKEWMSKGQLISIHSKEPTLEQIFLKLTGREL